MQQDEQWRPIQEVSKPHDGLYTLWNGKISWGYFNADYGNWWDWTEDYMDIQPTLYLLVPNPPAWMTR